MGRSPCFVMEVTSRSTRQEDLRKKKDLYRQLGVDEYFLFDPREEYLEPPLQGFRLVNGPGGEYRPVLPQEGGSLFSAVLGIVFRWEGETLRLINARTSKPYLRSWEKDRALSQSEEWAAAARREAEMLAAQETRTRQALEAEIAELRRQLKSGETGCALRYPPGEPADSRPRKGGWRSTRPRKLLYGRVSLFPAKSRDSVRESRDFVT